MLADIIVAGEGDVVRVARIIADPAECGFIAEANVRRGIGEGRVAGVFEEALPLLEPPTAAQDESSEGRYWLTQDVTCTDCWLGTAVLTMSAPHAVGSTTTLESEQHARPAGMRFGREVGKFDGR